MAFFHLLLNDNELFDLLSKGRKVASLFTVSKVKLPIFLFRTKKFFKLNLEWLITTIVNEDLSI